jgi:hypothetical protein
VWYDLLDDDKVLKAIRLELLRGGCPAHKVDDKVRDVVEEVFKYLKAEVDRGEPPVDDVDRMLAIVRPKAYQRGIDALRGEYAQGEVFAGSTEEHHDQAAPSSVEDQLEARKAVEDIRAHQSPQESAIMEGVGKGLTHKEIAEQQKVSHGHVRNVASSFGERHGPRLVRAGYALAGVALGVLLAVLFRTPKDDQVATPDLPHDDVEHATPSPSKVAAPNPGDDLFPQHPPPPKPSLTRDQRELVADLRASGHARAQAKDWKLCWQLYFAAENIDPDGTPPDALIEATMCKEQLDKAARKPR